MDVLLDAVLQLERPLVRQVVERLDDADVVRVDGVAVRVDVGVGVPQLVHDGFEEGCAVVGRPAAHVPPPSQARSTARSSPPSIRSSPVCAVFLLISVVLPAVRRRSVVARHS
jgi:hypothetical protein